LYKPGFLQDYKIYKINLYRLPEHLHRLPELVSGSPVIKADAETSSARRIIQRT